MRGVALTQRKGGSGKTVLSHALALGAAWHNVPAYLMHTDNREPLKVNGRPYMYYDARDPKTLQTLVDEAINADGLCIIDSAGNRPEFDKWIAQYVDLVLIPVMPDPEDVKEALVQMDVPTSSITTRPAEWNADMLSDICARFLLRRLWVGSVR